MQRVNVLHLITHLGFGGALDNTLTTIKGLSRARYEVHLAAGELEPDSVYSDWTPRARRSADALFIFPELRRPIDVQSDIRALHTLTKFMRDHAYQIVHTHCAKAGVLGRIAARRANVPVVINTFHSFPWQVAHQFHGSGSKNHLSRLKERLYIGIERYVAKFSDALITVADLAKREAIDREIATPDKFTTIYSGIDLPTFRESSSPKEKVCQRFGLDPALPIVGMIGRLSIQKAPLDFVRASKITLQHHPHAQFIIAGDGPLTADVSKSIGSERRIKLLGFVENVHELLTILDVFALSSLWEGLGRALTEAQIMHVPVAATSVGGVPELVVHKQTGLLSPPGQPELLAENIIWLLSHPEEGYKMSECARQRVLPAFGGKHMVEQIEALYERLLLEKDMHCKKRLTDSGRRARS